MRYMDLAQPRSKSELQVFTEAGRSEHDAAGDFLGQMRPSFQSALRRSVPNGALSSALIAARIARQMQIAADANKTAARAFMRLWYRYEELVLNPQTGNNVPFDLYK